MGLLDRVGLFDRGKMDKRAGEWAAKAMGCMVFADGKGPGDAEIAAFQVQVKTNRVLTDSIGSKNAEGLFYQTVEAIKSLPAVMLQTHEAELGQLAQEIEDLTAKNFALATVIAVAMGDDTVTPAEHAMLARFHSSLGATIAIPNVGQVIHDFEEAAIKAGAAPPTPVEQAPVTCPSCKQPTQFYQGHGHWCAPCQQYAPEPAESARRDTPVMPLPAVDD